jgi:hypothetical protein
MSTELGLIQTISPSYGDGLLENINRNTNDIKRLTTMIVKLIQLLIDEKIPQEEFINMSLKYDNRLSSALELREIYNRRVQEDTLVNLKELETVLENKELICVRRKIDDMEEEEYEIKLAAVDWDIDRINKRAEYLQKSINLLKALPSKIESKDALFIDGLSKDECKTIKNIKLETETKNRLMKNIKALSKILS